MKALLIMIVALFANYTLANNWKEINQNREGYSVRLSYTSDWLPATYGSEGGAVAGIFYADIYSSAQMNAERIEIFEEMKDGRVFKVSDFKFSQDNSRHFFAKKPSASSYADHIWFRKNYIYKITVDGKVIEGKFKI